MDLDNLCRTCLRTPKQSKDLFEDTSNLVEKIKVIASVDIKDITELPKQICEECYSNINNFYRFRKVIINSYLDLQSRLHTLKLTNYTSKPRSNEKQNSINDESSIHSSDIKAEIFLQSENDETSEPEPLEDEDTIKALAMRKLVKCNQCNKTFDSKFKLYNHKRTEHTTRGVCGICGSRIRPDNLSKHIKMHSDQPCKCEICGKIFKNSESLRAHKALHAGNSYICELCGKCFNLKSEHTRHLKKHADPDYRKVSCVLCGKKVHEIKKHMLTHTGGKPHPCDVCQKGFTSRYALKVHKRQHTNEKPYVCHLCGYGFPQKVSLVTHFKSKHGIT